VSGITGAGGGLNVSTRTVSRRTTVSRLKIVGRWRDDVSRGGIAGGTMTRRIVSWGTIGNAVSTR
jgi:hypothetical protein